MGNFLLGICIGGLSMVGLLTVFTEGSRFYIQGVEDTHKEAYAHGLMVKEITEEDEVIYKWKTVNKN
jgi:hypothetical protein